MITVVGAGKIGSACALRIVSMHIAEVTLIDIQGGLAQGEALDMIQASPLMGFDGEIRGSADFSEMAGSELVIVTAGYPRKPDTSRRDLAQGNAKIVSSVVQEIVRYAPKSKILMVTNPVDAMTYIAYRKSGFNRNRVLGMSGLLDASRYRAYLAHELKISRSDIQGLVIGEHGDLMIPLIEYTSVSGVPMKRLMSTDKIQEIVERTRTGGMDVIKKKGATVHAPASAVAVMADAIINDRRRVMAASVIPDGEYGIRDVSIGLPIVLGGDGVERIVELDLDAEERRLLSEAASSVKAVIAQIDTA
ncbi:malate dehydrogenase [Candidatus Bathyarchaeota archaeon]|nr:malate dehydrogenase [Candidatus Bathyarchaeota archaeon]